VTDTHEAARLQLSTLSDLLTSAESTAGSRAAVREECSGLSRSGVGYLTIIFLS